MKETITLSRAQFKTLEDAAGLLDCLREILSKSDQFHSVELALQLPTEALMDLAEEIQDAHPAIPAPVCTTVGG